KVIDWIVVRNRLSIMGSRNRRLIETGLHELAGRLGFRFADGFAERIVYREFFPRGLSALDEMDEQTLGTRPSVAHLTARHEVQAVLASLKLRTDDRGGRGAEAGARWLASVDTPLELHDILVG